MKKTAVKFAAAIALSLGATYASYAGKWYTFKSDTRKNGTAYQNDSFKDPSFWVAADGTTKMTEFSTNDESFRRGTIVDRIDQERDVVVFEAVFSKNGFSIAVR